MTDFVHIDIGGNSAATRHQLIIGDKTTPDELRSAAKVAENNLRMNASALLLQLAEAHETSPTNADPVNHPAHHNGHPSGVECIQVAEHMGFNLGNALKYIWRADLKGDAIEDLRKADWYLNREIQRRTVDSESGA